MSTIQICSISRQKYKQSQISGFEKVGRESENNLRVQTCDSKAGF